MICSSPIFIKEAKEVLPCGQCEHCRISKRKEWTGRQILESKMHQSTVFVTLTYNDTFLPAGGNLSRVDITNYLKRLRKLLAPKKFRYFGCAEYGENGTERPHYHLNLFGLSISDTPFIKAAWMLKGKSMGFTVIKPFEVQRAAYCAGYVTKKMTSDKTDFQKAFLKGRNPEFPLMSRDPAIGSSSLEVIADSTGGLLDEFGDVIKTFKHQKKSYYLGRTLTNKLRGILGVTEEEKNLSVLQKKAFKFQEENAKVELFKKENHEKILNDPHYITDVSVTDSDFKHLFYRSNYDEIALSLYKKKLKGEKRQQLLDAQKRNQRYFKRKGIL